VRSYDELHWILRARATELQITRETIDAVSGLQSGYSAKLLAPVPIKSLGKTSMGLMLQTLGVVLIAVEDQEALSRLRSRLVPRLRPDLHASDVGRDVEKTSQQQVLWRAWSRLMNEKRRSKVSAAERKIIARIAALTRWRGSKASRLLRLKRWSATRPR
jgi:hypothetical protein